MKEIQIVITQTKGASLIMGQAKRRGTYEERKALAKKRDNKKDEVREQIQDLNNKLDLLDQIITRLSNKRRTEGGIIFLNEK